nr:peptidylprolyl isomerase [uncultured Cellulosilyticum sp.]
MKSLRRIFSMACILTLMLFALAGCGSSQSPQSSSNTNGNTTNNESMDNANSNINTEEQQVVALQENPIVTMKIKDYGDITLELYPEMAPNTVNNFVTLANDGFYDGLIFHRVISGFMIQGGDPQGTGIGGPDYSIPGEFAANGFTQNTLSHTKGILSMARTNNPDSAGSQFFIMSADGTYLDGQYAAFGKVTDGLDIVEEIQDVPTNSSDKPLEDIVIESIRVDTHGETVPTVIKVK